MTHKPTRIPLYFFFLFLVSNGMGVKAQKLNVNSKTPFAGTWSYGTDKFNFDITLAQQGDSIKGTYCAASQKWADCWDSGASYCVLKGVVRLNRALIIFNSNFAQEDSKDTAIVLYNKKDDTLLWQRETHTIQSHVPDRVKLEKYILTDRGFKE